MQILRKSEKNFNYNTRILFDESDVSTLIWSSAINN